MLRWWWLLALALRVSLLHKRSKVTSMCSCSRPGMRSTIPLAQCERRAIASLHRRFWYRTQMRWSMARLLKVCGCYVFFATFVVLVFYSRYFILSCGGLYGRDVGHKNRHFPSQKTCVTRGCANFENVGVFSGQRLVPFFSVKTAYGSAFCIDWKFILGMYRRRKWGSYSFWS